MANVANLQRNNQTGKTSVSNQKVFTQKELQEIEKLAYQFFVDRGYEHGHDQEDWAKAEQIVRSR